MLTGGALAAVDQTRGVLECLRSNCAFGLAHVEVASQAQGAAYFRSTSATSTRNILRISYSGSLDWGSNEKGHGQVQTERRDQRVPIIATAIRDSVRPVVLITHSKGSVEPSRRCAPSRRFEQK